MKTKIAKKTVDKQLRAARNEALAAIKARLEGTPGPPPPWWDQKLAGGVGRGNASRGRRLDRTEGWEG